MICAWRKNENPSSLARWKRKRKSTKKKIDFYQKSASWWWWWRKAELITIMHEMLFSFCAPLPEEERINWNFISSCGDVLWWGVGSLLSSVSVSHHYRYCICRTSHLPEECEDVKCFSSFPSHNLLVYLQEISLVFHEKFRIWVVVVMSNAFHFNRFCFE